MMPDPIQKKARHAQPGARGDYRSISFRILGACVQRNEILGVEPVDSVGISFKIVNHSHGIEFKLLSQVARINHPRQIGNLAPAASHGPSNAEACAMRRDPFRIDESGDDLGQTAVLLAHVGLFDHEPEPAAFLLECREPGTSSAALSCKYHGSILLHWRSSPFLSSSSSFGPQLPAP